MKYGQGSVWQRADGKWRAKLPGRRGRSLGVFDTEEQGWNAIADVRAELAARGTPTAGTFAEFGRRVLDMREGDGIRGIRQERQRFRTHLESSALGPRGVAEVLPIHVVDLARVLGRRIGHETVKRCVSLASAIFDEAVMRGIRPDNPCRGIRLRKKTTDTEDPWDYLRPEEITAATEHVKIPEWARCLLGFAIGTGLRQGEQWNLELRDLHVDGDDPHVLVRFGSKGQLPKNGRVRRVPLFGLGLASARRWLEIRDAFLAPAKKRAAKRGEKLPCPELVFPTSTGHRRASGAPEKSVRLEGGKKQGKVELLPEWLKLAGVERAIRWHDLRHTCASALVAGWWGRAWTLEEVKEMLGHRSITTTQRYAHLGENSLRRAARETGHGRREDVRVEGPSDHNRRGRDQAGRSAEDPLLPEMRSGNDLLRGTGKAERVPLREVRPEGVVSTPDVRQALENLPPEILEILSNLAQVGRPGLEPGTYGLKGPDVPQQLPAVTPNMANTWRTFQLFTALQGLLQRQGGAVEPEEPPCEPPSPSPPRS